MSKKKKTDKSRLYDNTRVQDFRTCPRYFYFRHMRHWRLTETALPLIYGSCWHEAMDSIWAEPVESFQNLNNITDVVNRAMSKFLVEWISRGLPEPAEMGPEMLEKLAPRHPYIAMEMLYASIHQRAVIFTDKSFELLDIERPFVIPLDPDDPTLLYIGRLDKVFKLRKRIHIGEHKTTTLYKKAGNFRDIWIQSFSPNSQVDGYLFASNLLYGKEFKEVWVDGALVHKTVHDGFTFIPIQRNFSQLDGWLWEVRYWIQEIEMNKAALLDKDHSKEKILACFPKNTNSCINYSRACPYMDLCKMKANPEQWDSPPQGYVEEVWDPTQHIDVKRLTEQIEEAVK